MQTREELLAALIKIKDEINDQIPLAANNFEEYESAPQGADFAAVHEKYELHEKKFAIARQEYLIYEYINELLVKFLLEKEVRDARSLTLQQLEDAKHI